MTSDECDSAISFAAGQRREATQTSRCEGCHEFEYCLERCVEVSAFKRSRSDIRVAAQLAGVQGRCGNDCLWRLGACKTETSTSSQGRYELRQGLLLVCVMVLHLHTLALAMECSSQTP